MSSGVGTAQSALAIGFVFPILGGIFVALRFFTRQHQKLPRQIDDWLCIPAWLCLTGCCASLLTGIYLTAFSDPNQEQVLAQVTAALVIFWMFGNACVKLCILFFYRRVFVGSWFNIASWVLISFSIVWLIYALLSWFLYCGTDLHADFEGGWLACPLWGFDIQMGVFVLDTVIDFSVLLVPIPFVWRLQLNLTKKIIIIFIFLLGGLAFIAGLFNTIIQLTYLLNPAIAAGGGSNFFQGSGLLFSNWPAIEVGVGLIACNLPSLSFRAASALPQQMRHAWMVSWSGIRHAAAIFSLRSSTHSSSAHRTNIDTNITRVKSNGTSLPDGSECQDSFSTRGDIPLVPVRADNVLGSETKRANMNEYWESTDGKQLRRDE